MKNTQQNLKISLLQLPRDISCLGHPSCDSVSWRVRGSRMARQFLSCISSDYPTCPGTGMSHRLSIPIGGPRRMLLFADLP